MPFLSRRRTPAGNRPGPRRLSLQAEPLVARDRLMVLADAEVAYTILERSGPAVEAPQVSPPEDTELAVEQLAVTVLRNLAAQHDHEELLTSSWTTTDQLTETLRLAVPAWRVTIDEVRVVLRRWADGEPRSHRLGR